MKKSILALAIAGIFLLAGCSSKEAAAKNAVTKTADSGRINFSGGYVSVTPGSDDVTIAAGQIFEVTDPDLKELLNEYIDTIDRINAMSADLPTGFVSFSDFDAHKDELQAWTDSVYAETEALMEKTKQTTAKYYKNQESKTTDPKELLADCDQAYDVIHGDLLYVYRYGISHAYGDDLYNRYYDSLSSLWDIYGKVTDYSVYKTATNDLWDIFSKVRSDVPDLVYDTSDAVLEEWKGKRDAYGEARKNDVPYVAEENETPDDSAEESTDKTAEPTEEPSSASSETVTDSADFREMMDSYEAFIDKYVDFMTTYQESDDQAAMLADYTELMQEYADFAEKVNAVDESQLSEEDYAYYLEVMNRCNEKMLAAAA